VILLVVVVMVVVVDDRCWMGVDVPSAAVDEDEADDAAPPLAAAAVDARPLRELLGVLDSGDDRERGLSRGTATHRTIAPAGDTSDWGAPYQETIVQSAPY
jgi:hypothetical protein